MNNKTVKIGWIRYEIFTVLLIIACIIYSISYESYMNRHNAISITKNGTISILHDIDTIEIFQEYDRPIIYFTRNACEFIAVYTQDNEIHSLVILDNVEYMHEKIDSIFDWKHIFETNVKGEIDLDSEGLNMSINYEWIEFESGQKYLVVYNINKTDHKLFNIFNILQYISIALSFIVLISLIYWQHRSIINKYKRVNDQVQEIIRK